jgi:hypothetical protein
MDVCVYETRSVDGRFQQTLPLFRIKPKDKLALHGFISPLKNMKYRYTHGTIIKYFFVQSGSEMPAIKK